MVLCYQCPLYVYFVVLCHPNILLISMKSFCMMQSAYCYIPFNMNHNTEHTAMHVQCMLCVYNDSTLILGELIQVVCVEVGMSLKGLRKHQNLRKTGRKGRRKVLMQPHDACDHRFIKRNIQVSSVVDQ